MSSEPQLPLPIINHVVRTGSSLAVVVPAKFVQRTGIRSGDKVDVNIDYQAGTITYKFLTVRQLNLV
jgi:antitoxin component of MazEF toxin-antitoxin module